MKATIKFPSRDMAKEFASAWAFRSLMGCDMSPTSKDGETSVTIYNITEDLKVWVDEKISSMNKTDKN
jgi:hypothetical protein